MGLLHLISRFIRRIVEHKRFRWAVASQLILAVLFASSLQKASAFTASDFQAPLATEEVILTTKQTSRLPVFGRLSQSFSYYHPGVDIEKEFDDPVYPFLEGRVFETGFQGGGYGNYVLIDHKNGYFSLYAHLNKLLVKKDDEIVQETVIGTVGLTGYTTGSHLHFEIYENGYAVNPLAILPELPFATASANPKQYVGGPNSYARLLVLPISLQVPNNDAGQTPIEVEEKKSDVGEIESAKPSLGIWLPSELTHVNPTESSAPADSKANRLLPKLLLF